MRTSLIVLASALLIQLLATTAHGMLHAWLAVAFGAFLIPGPALTENP
jgi:hypothetical protein